MVWYPCDIWYATWYGIHVVYGMLHGMVSMWYMVCYMVWYPCGIWYDTWYGIHVVYGMIHCMVSLCLSDCNTL